MAIIFLQALRWWKTNYCDKKITFLLYAGCGFAYRFGNKKKLALDNRIGIGATSDADRNSVYPVFKTGIGPIL